MAVGDFREDLDIVTMVYNRLPFLANTPDNTTKIGQTVLEVMHELEICFQIDTDAEFAENETTWIGLETKYTVAQRAVIADVVCVYLLLFKIVNVSLGESSGDTDGSTDGRFLKKTKAGSVEVEWDQLDSKKGGIAASFSEMVKMYQGSARRKARLLGCGISWDNNDMIVDCEVCAIEPYPFVVGEFDLSSGISDTETAEQG